MRTRSLLAALCVAAIISIITGCSHSQPMVIQPVKDGAPETVSRANPSTNDPTEPGFNAPAALERRTAAYSQQVQAMLDANGKSPATEPAVETPKPSPAQEQANNVTAPPVRATWDDSPELQSKKPFTRDVPTAPVQKKNPEIAEKETGANVPAAIEPAAPIPAKATILPSGSNEIFQKVDRRVKEYPRDLSAHLDYQLMRFLLDDRVPDLGSLSSLPTEDRELIASLIDGLSNFRSAIRADNNMLLSHKVRPLLEMADRLRGHADLSIPAIALCTRVRTFGEYDPIEPAQFTAGAVHDVILYCEVENFSSQLDDQQQWQTKLTQEAVLYTENGMQVWSEKSEPINDLARHRRHDFYVVKRMSLPSTLTVGRYLLKVTIVDQQMSRVAEATVPIVIAVQ